MVIASKYAFRCLFPLPVTMHSRFSKSMSVRFSLTNSPTLTPVEHKKSIIARFLIVPACCPASCLRPLGAKRRALDDHSPETLLAGAAALAAKRIVGDTVALIEEERPFFLALLAHSRHGGSFLPFLSM